MALNDYSVEIDPVDLSEAPRLEKDANSRGPVIGAVCLLVAFAAMMIHGSLPELTPKDIVAMDGYVGEPPTRHIFNLQSFEDEQSAQNSPDENNGQEIAADDTMVAGSKEIVAVATPEQIQPDSKAVISAINAAGADQADLSSVEIPDQAKEQQAKENQAKEQPAKEQIIEKTIVASSTVPNTTKPVLEELPTTVVKPAALAAEPVPLKRAENTDTELVAGNGATKNTGDSTDFLPMLRVLGEATILRASPSIRSRGVLSLGAGVTVTMFEQQGDWVHIGVNDGSAITGYLLANELGNVK